MFQCFKEDSLKFVNIFTEISSADQEFFFVKAYAVNDAKCTFYISINFSSGLFLIQDVVRLSFFSQPDGPVTGSGSFKSSVLVPGYAPE
jgi:hypothetical protein